MSKFNASIFLSDGGKCFIGSELSVLLIGGIIFQFNASIFLSDIRRCFVGSEKEDC